MHKIDHRVANIYSPLCYQHKGIPTIMRQQLSAAKPLQAPLNTGIGSMNDLIMNRELRCHRFCD